MAIEKKWNILFIQEEKSKFDTNTKLFDRLFNKVDKILGEDKALSLAKKSKYDIVICDLSVKPERLGFMKQMQDTTNNQAYFALVDPQDTGILYGIADLGINAIELVPEQFEQALEAIAGFNPYDAS